MAGSGQGRCDATVRLVVSKLLPTLAAARPEVANPDQGRVSAPSV